MVEYIFGMMERRREIKNTNRIGEPTIDRKMKRKIRKAKENLNKEFREAAGM